MPSDSAFSTMLLHAQLVSGADSRLTFAAAATANVWMSNILSAADWSQAPM
jgi:hypothetical protein